MSYTNRTFGAVLAAAWIFGAAGGAAAQTGGEGAFDEVVEVRPVEDGVRENALIERASAERRSRRVVADGRFLVGVRGRLERSIDDRWVMLIENGGALGIDAERMVLQPSTRLMEMGRIVSGRTRDVGFEVNGQVFLFKGENYLLPMSFDVLRVDGSGGLPVKTDDSPSAGDGLPVEATDVDSMLASLTPTERESRREEVDSGGEEEEREVKVAPLREGTMFVSRLGRLVGQSEGGWAFRIDTDADSDPDSDPPMTVLACAMLERMEAVMISRPSPPRMTVSGSVYVYQGENYLLPVMMLIEPVSEGGLVTAQ